MSNINGGQVFPYACPAEVEIPQWAWQNNANGALSVGLMCVPASLPCVGDDQKLTLTSSCSFRNAYGNPLTSLSSSSTTSPPATATTDYTELSGKQTVSSVPAGDMTDEQAEHDVSKSVMATLLGVRASLFPSLPRLLALAVPRLIRPPRAVVPVIFIALVIIGVCVYLRKKRRRFRGRGHKLDSSAELPEHAAGHLYGSDAISSTAGFSSSTAGGFMKQKDSRVSVFARPAPSTARSFTTNSVSTGVPVGAFRRESTLYSASTGFDTLTRSSAFSYDPSDDSYRDEREDASLADHHDDDDESISPFADIHRPAPSLTATRDNIHSAPGPASASAYARSFSTFSLSASTTRSSSHGAALQPDAASLRTTTTSASSQGAPPSSSGATYGGARDDEDEDDEGLSERGSLRR